MDSVVSVSPDVYGCLQLLSLHSVINGITICMIVVIIVVDTFIFSTSSKNNIKAAHSNSMVC